MKRLILVCTTMLFFFCTFSIPASAATIDESVLFSTTTSNVSVWSEPTSTGTSTKVDIIEEKHTPVLIEYLTENEYGNIWGKVLAISEYDGYTEQFLPLEIYTEVGYIYIESSSGKTGNLEYCDVLQNDYLVNKQLFLKNIPAVIEHACSETDCGLHIYQVDTDYCVACQTVFWHEYSVELPFETINSTAVWSEANSASKKLDTLPIGTDIQIVARAVNQYGNHWGKTADGTYVFMDNLAFDLDQQIEDAVAYMTESKMSLWDFYSMSKTNSEWDLKVYLTYNREYNVILNGELQDITLTGEQIGNFHYGAIGSLNYSKTTLLTISDGIASGSDTEDDIAAIVAGYNYYTTGTVNLTALD